MLDTVPGPITSGMMKVATSGVTIHQEQSSTTVTRPLATLLQNEIHCHQLRQVQKALRFLDLLEKIIHTLLEKMHKLTRVRQVPPI